MAGLLVGHVLERWPGRDALQMLIAVVLADAADADGSNVYPSVERVARLARCSVRSVQYALRQFIEIGFLLLEQPGGGRGRPARYRIVRDWLEAQESALADWQKRGAYHAGNTEKVHADALSLQKSCENPADSVHQFVHPTQQPKPSTHKVAARRQAYELTQEGVVVEPGNVLDALGATEIQRLEAKHPGITEQCIREVVQRGKMPFVSAVLCEIHQRVRLSAEGITERLRVQSFENLQLQEMKNDPEAQAVGEKLIRSVAKKRAATKLVGEVGNG